MRMMRWLLLGLGLTWLGGCESDTTPARTGEPVAIARELKGQQGPFPDRGFLVIQRPEVWRALWAGNPPAEIDFSRQTVLAALMGRQSTAGYTITISEVRGTTERAVAYVTETRPGADAVVAQVITYPYHIVVTPKLAVPVEFAIDGARTRPIAIQDQFEGTQSQARAARTAVIRTADDWGTFWTATFGGDARAPAVDFTRYMAVAILMGEKPTAGYAVHIAAIETDDDYLIARYRTRAPGPDDVVAKAITAPYAIAIIPTSAQAVAFQEIPATPAAP